MTLQLFEAEQWVACLTCMSLLVLPVLHDTWYFTT